MTDPKTQRTVFRTVTLLIAGDTALFTLVIPALPIFADRYDLSDPAVVLIFGIFPLAQLLTVIPLIGALDRIGRRPTMVAGSAALLVSTAGFAFADSLPLLILTRALQGSAAALVWTAGLAAISDVYPQSQLGFRMGMAETVGGGIGLIGPVAGGALIELVGTDEAFAIATVLPLVLLVLTLRVPESTHATEGAPPLREAFRRIASRPEARAGLVALIAFAGMLAVVDSLLPLDLDERLDASTAAIGVVFGIGLAGLVIVAPLAGALVGPPRAPAGADRRGAGECGRAAVHCDRPDLGCRDRLFRTRLRARDPCGAQLTADRAGSRPLRDGGHVRHQLGDHQPGVRGRLRARSAAGSGLGPGAPPGGGLGGGGGAGPGRGARGLPLAARGALAPRRRGI